MANGWFDFVNGQTLPASRVQDYLMNQSVMVFIDDLDRSSGIPTPTAGTSETDVYTVPSSTQTIVSTLSITNVTGSPASARVWIRVNGATAATSNAVLYDVPVAANSVAAFTLGLTVDAADVITVRSSTGNALTFQLFGSEIS